LGQQCRDHDGGDPDRSFTLPSGSKDSAVLITLNPGAYTAQNKSAKNASSGVALIEIYEVP
jgi:hypothetical protein